jgi:hypothetical protein
MVQNFITDLDLVPYYPQIAKLLYAGETTHEIRRMQAFDLLLDDFRFRGIDARRLHIPIDLNRSITETAAQNKLTVNTKTATFTSEFVYGLQGFKRFVIGATTLSLAATYSIKFQGSNDTTEEPTNWEDIGTFSISATGNTTVVMQTEYLFYRYILTITGTGNIVYTAALYETYIDRLIVLKTFQLIFRNLVRERNDVWDQRLQAAETDYETTMQVAKYCVDSNKDNLPDEDETEEGTGEISLMR